MAKDLSVIDFFCGSGGFSEGFRRAGYKVVMGIDNWKPAIETHNFNHGLNDTVRSVLDFEDINAINDLPNTDIIVGSPPCVSFSLSNKGGGADKSLGIRLIEAYLRVVAVKKHQSNSILKAWLMENVPSSKNYLKEVYTFNDLGLKDWAKAEGIRPSKVAIKIKNNGDILSSDDYGSGQIRKRFICGEIVSSGKFPSPKVVLNSSKSLRTLFSGFPSPMGVKYSKTKLVSDPNYPEIKIPISDLHDHFYDTGVYRVEWEKAQNAKLNHPYMGRMSFPENLDKPSRTVMATRSASTREAILYKSELNRKGDGEYRTPTVREAAVIMGFPVTYQFYGDESTKWRQVGNAVCVQLSFALAEKVKDELGVALSTARVSDKKISNICFLDNSEPKIFNKPPKKNPKSLFRMHPIKSGNMTVALTNKNDKSSEEWSIVAHAGTGIGYNSVTISPSHSHAAKEILIKNNPLLVKSLDKDPYINKLSVSDLNSKNEEYGATSNDKRHPYKIIKNISYYITSSISDDVLIDVRGTELATIKQTMPLSQVSSVYALSKLLFDL